MSSVTKTRLFSFLSTLIIVPLITIVVILFARGYRPDFVTKKLEPTGILAATSLPDGAQVIVNGEIKTATNNSLNLSPGEYSVQIKKASFHPWTKTLQIQKEAVTRASAFLFTNVPTLKAITSTGASHPTLSPDGAKVVFISNRNLYQLDIAESLGFISHEPQSLISNFKFKILNSLWSPDSRQILLQSSSSAQLVDINSGKITETSIGLPALLSDWQTKKIDSYQRQFASLPENLQTFLATSSSQISWSINDKKILYTATASAIIPDRLSPPLPGSSTQTQSRQLTPYHRYVYDLEEDRNFDIGTSSQNWSWYPTGNHVYRLDKDNIIIKEYDNANEIFLFAGNLAENFAIPYPSGKQLLVLITTSASPLPNLYSVNLK